VVELRRCTNAQKDGVRQIRRLVQEQVEGPLAAFLLATGKKTACVQGVVEEGELRFSFASPVK